MSIPVEIPALGQELATRRYGYLLTTSDDLRPHGVAVSPTFVDGQLVAQVGHRTAANVRQRALVSVVFPSGDIDGFSLIVDGTARMEGDCAVVSPTWAVLHRPAPPPTAA